jgi:hypothetical protein
VPVLGEGVGRRCWRVNIVSIHIYLNRKMKPIETIPEKENDGEGKLNYGIL